MNSGLHRAIRFSMFLLICICNGGQCTASRATAYTNVVGNFMKTVNQRIAFLIICCLTIISYRQTERSNQLMKEAMDVYLFSKLDDGAKVDSSLALTNKALELDDQNVQALSHKTALLFRKKDIDGMLQTVDELIRLRPEKPYYLVQKALYLELKGDNSKASEYYDSASAKYQRYLKRDSLDFNLLLEYVGLLEVTGDTTSASETLERMESLHFDDSQKEILRAYRSQAHKNQSFSRDKLIKYWSGEIGYEQLEEK